MNLLVQLETDLTGYDFSRLTIRNCDLRSLNLHGVNFTQATFRDCVFSESNFYLILLSVRSPTSLRSRVSMFCS
ncbi:pentapeptide repeat-containing protein [Chlorogloeopsis fritschii]|uniref:pentapeptide repeat-containing protein n=1 Tax=Chlorogloeopsis fritschii TaxID=1124 RepID=UPI002283D63F|nr:pentapeptide repeat-containing protein [Chlorogloeopsis fritschii]